MDILANLFNGFTVSLAPVNLLYCFLGILFGTLIGILPGIGTFGAIALLLPFSNAMEPTAALILFCSIYCGSKYGGSTSSILLNVPGESDSIITCLDGYAMAQNGRAGAALGICAIGSFVAGTLGLVGLTFFAPALSEIALNFGPPELFVIALTGTIIFTRMTGRELGKTTLLFLFGTMLATVGHSSFFGLSRLSYNIEGLESGFDVTLVAMGFFGVSELLAAVAASQPQPRLRTPISAAKLYPTREEYQRSKGPILRGSLLGFFLGLLPIPATIISTFASYSLEKRLGRKSAVFGRGAIEGVAGPEAANNSAVIGTIVPMLSLGLPFSSTTAIILCGLTLHGIIPGPTLIANHPDIFWGIIASLYIGNCMLLFINYPLALLFIQILRIPPSLLTPIVFAFILTGAYILKQSVFDLLLIIAFGLLGFFCKRAGYDLGPLIVGIVMGPELEQRFHQTFVIGQYSLHALFSRPLSIFLLIVGAILIALTFKSNLLKNQCRQDSLKSS